MDTRFVKKLLEKFQCSRSDYFKTLSGLDRSIGFFTANIFKFPMVLKGETQ